MCRQESRPNSQRQRGAIMILFAVSLTVLLGFMALAIDLGRTYVVRTELQNAADAAALAGAKELNQKASGVCCGLNSAVTKAISMAAQNNFKFSAPVVITIANISVGSCPDDSCMVLASTVTTDALAGGRTFLKVDIPTVTLTTFFGGFVGATTTSTYGRAVAGRFVNDVTPIGICAIQNASGVSRPEGEVLSGTNELAQFGFRRGVSYNVFSLGNIGGSPVPYLIDPVDAYPNPCVPNNSSANSTAPFVCGGSSAVLSTSSGFVYGNTGVTVGKIEKALNSRFNDYTGASVCIPTQAPPDVNVRHYACTGGSCDTPAVNWMNPTPTVQTMIAPGMPIAPASIASADKYGVLWSYSRAVRADTTTTPPTPGAQFSTTDWATLYPANAGVAATNGNFPTSPTSPYLDAGNAAHFIGPTVNTGLLNRRVLNLAIANCAAGAVTGTGSCQLIPILGIGRFFMQVPADIGASKLEVEFAGLVEPVPLAEIRLYR